MIGGGGRTRTYEGVSQRIYSVPVLVAGIVFNSLKNITKSKSGDLFVAAFSRRNLRVFSTARNGSFLMDVAQL
jgi:hypothetical protein